MVLAQRANWEALVAYASMRAGRPATSNSHTHRVLLQRKCACQGSSASFGACETCKPTADGPLQRQSVGRAEPTAVPLIVHEVLRSPGQPLDAATRADMEPRFGHDFSKVRVHADGKAGEAAGSIDARAFTSGSSIVFGYDEYTPRTESGRRLVAHELTHIVQQRAGVHLKDGVGESSDAYEQHADIVSRAFVGGRSSDGLLDAHRLPVAETIGGPLQSRVTIQRQTSEQLSISSEAASNQSVAVETTAEAPQSSDPQVIEAAVGANAKNRVDDVAKVQARLLAVGLLSEADFTAESLKAVTPASMKSATLPDASITGSMTPEAATTTRSESLSTTTTAPDLSAEASSASTTTVVAGTTPATIPESSLTATISAICEFQRPLFGKQDVDGNIGPTGPSWRALRTADAATVAKMKEGWSKKKQQMEEEKARKLKADAERKQREAWEQSPEAEQGRKTLADNLLAKYATYIPYTSWYISLDESGLAGALAILANSNGDVVLKVFDALYADDVLDVAIDMVEGKSVKELMTFDSKVLARLRRALSNAKTEQISQQLPIAGAKDNVPFYSQGDKRWKDITLGKSLKIGPKGCAMTSMTMAVSAISGKSIDPSEMDAYLDQHGGYAGDLIVWDKAAQAGGLTATKHNKFDAKILDESLTAGRPCVMSVNQDGHWVTVTAKRVENERTIYTIHDPATGKAADMNLENGALVGAKGAHSKSSGSYIITLEPKP
jgi:uncharacterized protein DUF4157/peptidase C39-like protein